MTVDAVAPVVRAVQVARQPADTFRVFTDEIGAWWPYGPHCVFGEHSADVAFVDGDIVETSDTGERCTWGSVTVWDPPHRVAFTWHPGYDDDSFTRVEVTFTADDGGTRVELTHSGWESLGARAAEARASYAMGWGRTLDAFAGHPAFGLAEP